MGRLFVDGCLQPGLLLRQRIATLYEQLRSRPILMISAVNGLVFLLAIITSVLLARQLPKSEYGQLVYFYTGVGMLRLLLNLGLGTIISRDIAATMENPARRNVVICSLGVVRLASLLIGILLIHLVATVVPIALLIPMAVAAVCTSLADFLFALVAGLRRTAYVAWMSAFQPVCYLLFISGALLFRQTNMTFLTMLYALSFLGMAGLGMGLSVADRVLSHPGRHDIQAGYIGVAVAYVVPSYLTSLLSQAWNILIVGAFGLSNQFERSAEFGVTFTIVTLVSAITGPAVLTVFFPQISYLFGANRAAELYHQIRQTFLLLLKVLVTAALLMATAAPLLVVIFGEQYAASVPGVIAMAPLALFAGLLPIATLSLFAVNRPWLALSGLSVQVLVAAAIPVWLRAITPNIMIATALISTGLALVVQVWVLLRVLHNISIDRDDLRTIGIAAGVLLLLELPVVFGIPPNRQSLVAGCLLIAYGIIVFQPLRLQLRTMAGAKPDNTALPRTTATSRIDASWMNPDPTVPPVDKP